MKSASAKKKTADHLQQQILDTYEADNNEYETGKSAIFIESSGTYFIGIHVFSDAPIQPVEDLTYFCIGSFSIEEKAISIPNPVSGLSVMPDPDKKLSAHLSWTNPSQWSDGKNISENIEAEIFRNGQLIKTLTNLVPGTVSEFDDTGVPAAGLYEYAVRIKIGDLLSIRVKSEQLEIGSLTIEAYLPYRIDFTRALPYGQPDDANPACTWEKWTKLNPDETSSGIWPEQLEDLIENEVKSGVCAYCRHTGEADAWAISPMIFLEKDKAYAVSYDYKKFPGTAPAYKEKFEMSVGKEKTADALKQHVFAVYEVENNEYRTETMVVQVQETGEYCIGLHCISLPTGNGASNLCLGSFSLEETTLVRPGTISQASARASDKERFVADLYWTNPALGTKNEPLEGALTAKIFRNGQLVKTLKDIEPGSTTTWSDKVGEEGRYVYSVFIGWRGIYNETTTLGSCELKPFFPMRITDLSVTLEQKEASLTWTNPVVYSPSGMSPSDIPLPDHFYIDIYRNRVLIETIGNQTPGSNGQYVDQIPSDKKWTYWVKCRLESGETSIESNTVTIDLTPEVKPDPPVNLKAVADASKELQVNLSWNNPVSGTKGEDLSGKQFKALIFREGELIETLIYLEAGSKAQWNERVEKEGAYIYSVALELDQVKSDTVDVACYVAYFKPECITDFSYKIENENLILQWKSPEKYENGSALNTNFSVNLYCNEELVTTFKNQTPGSQGTYTDVFNPAERKLYFLIVSLPNGACSSRSKTILINDRTDIPSKPAASVYYDSKTSLLHTGEITDVSIYNVPGNCVLKEMKVPGILDLKELPPGVYFIKIGNNSNHTLKILK